MRTRGVGGNYVASDSRHLLRVNVVGENVQPRS